MVWSWRSISDRESVNARADIRKLRNAEAVGGEQVSEPMAWTDGLNFDEIAASHNSPQEHAD
jgi:hypothetical protein